MLLLNSPKYNVEITATTLYEAAALALAEFQRCGFAEATFGPATKLTVRVRQPETSHTVSVARLRSWLDGVGKSPSEHVMQESAAGDRHEGAQSAI